MADAHFQQWLQTFEPDVVRFRWNAPDRTSFGAKLKPCNGLRLRCFQTDMTTAQMRQLLDYADASGDDWRWDKTKLWRQAASADDGRAALGTLAHTIWARDPLCTITVNDHKVTAASVPTLVLADNRRAKPDVDKIRAVLEERYKAKGSLNLDDEPITLEFGEKERFASLLGRKQTQTDSKSTKFKTFKISIDYLGEDGEKVMDRYADVMALVDEHVERPSWDHFWHNKDTDVNLSAVMKEKHGITLFAKIVAHLMEMGWDQVGGRKSDVTLTLSEYSAKRARV